MKTSELSTQAFEQVKHDLEESRRKAAERKLLQLLTNVIRPCEGCPIYKDCILPVKRLIEQ